MNKIFLSQVAAEGDVEQKFVHVPEQETMETGVETEGVKAPGPVLRGEEEEGRLVIKLFGESRNSHRKPDGTRISRRHL